MDDKKIISLFFSRDETAIEELKHKYSRLCESISRNILGNEEDVKECVSDTYLTVWNKIPPENPNSLMAFVSKITRNTALKKVEYNCAKKRSVNAVLSIEELSEILPDESVEESFDSKQIGVVLNKFLSELKPDVRKVFIRKYYFFESISEIAVRYSFSKSKVKSMLHHTKLKLREFLEKEGVSL